MCHGDRDRDVLVISERFTYDLAPQRFGAASVQARAKHSRQASKVKEVIEHDAATRGSAGRAVCVRPVHPVYHTVLNYKFHSAYSEYSIVHPVCARGSADHRGKIIIILVIST